MERIIKLVESLTRPGKEEVVKYLKESNFSSIKGGSTHHLYPGGLIDHSLEVYENMKKKTKGTGISHDSVIICSIFHDLGKTINFNQHPSRSISILKKCKFEITEEEKQAILNHHHVSDEDLNSPDNLGTYLKKSDMLSTGEYKAVHAKQTGNPLKDLFIDMYNTALREWAKN